MLQQLEQIPWANLEHAYGSAQDIPEKIRALLSDDSQEREWTQSMLEMGGFHQGSIYTCTPYIARFLIELVQRQEVQEKAWMFSYLSGILQRAHLTLTSPEQLPDDDKYEEWAGKTLGELRKSDRAIARQIRDEILPHANLFVAGLNSPEPEGRLSVIRFLMEQDDGLNGHKMLYERFAIEQDELVRTVLAFAIGVTVASHDQSVIRNILEDGNLAPLIRMSAGFGWIAAMKEHMPNEALTILAGLFETNMNALNELDDIHQDWLESPAFTRLFSFSIISRRNNSTNLCNRYSQSTRCCLSPKIRLCELEDVITSKHSVDWRFPTTSFLLRQPYAI